MEMRKERLVWWTLQREINPPDLSSIFPSQKPNVGVIASDLSLPPWPLLPWEKEGKGTFYSSESP